MSPATEAIGLRLALARVVAWSVLLAGWVGVGSVVQAQAAGPAGALAVMALWFVAVSVGTAALARWHVSTTRLRVFAAFVALVIATAAWWLPRTGNAFAVIALVAGWALLAVMACAVVRACRDGRRAPAASLANAAAIGAAIAWAWIGDLTDLARLQGQLAAGAVFACAVLAACVPRFPVHAGACRSALFDCTMAAWPADLLRRPARWPLVLASLSMLPMMMALPLMLGLCSTEAVGPRLALALHLAAMFSPAWLFTRRRWSGSGAAGVCAILLMAGVWSFATLSGAAAWWALAASHGTAWSVAWAARLVDAGVRRGARAPQRLLATSGASAQ